MSPRQRTDYNTGILPGNFGYLKLDIKLAALSDATAFVYLWNTRLGKYDNVTTAPATGGVISVERTEAQTKDYVTGTGTVAALVRIVRPVRFCRAEVHGEVRPDVAPSIGKALI